MCEISYVLEEEFLKEIIFSEEQLYNFDEIGKELFKDNQDPRNTAYIRKLKRPKISVSRIISFYILIPALVLIAFIVTLNYLGLSTTTTVVIAAIILLAYILLTAKRMLISAIRIYQRYAPDSLRNKCRFEPSCSEYMILAIEKYGLIKGLQKGICRLKRCNIDGGGFDFP